MEDDKNTIQPPALAMCCTDPATDFLKESDLMCQSADSILPSLDIVLRYSRNFRTFFRLSSF